MKKPFRITQRIKSFSYAFAGVRILMKSQHNAWIHAGATLIVTGAGCIFYLTASEWCLLILAIMAVWITEALNTALEFLADAATPDYHPLVKHAKDAAAGAVLIAAIGSVIIGLLVFVPHLKEWVL